MVLPNGTSVDEPAISQICQIIRTGCLERFSGEGPTYSTNFLRCKPHRSSRTRMGRRTR